MPQAGVEAGVAEAEVGSASPSRHPLAENPLSCQPFEHCVVHPLSQFQSFKVAAKRHVAPCSEDEGPDDAVPLPTVDSYVMRWADHGDGRCARRLSHRFREDPTLFI